MFWDCSWSWHFLVVHNKLFCSRKMVLRWHCLGINIHESIHVKFKLIFMMKPIQWCIFIHKFWLFCLFYYYFRTFWRFTCRNLQLVFLSISKNNFISFTIYFLINILDAFKYLSSTSLCLGMISRNHFYYLQSGIFIFLQFLRCHIFHSCYQPW